MSFLFARDHKLFGIHACVMRRFTASHGRSADLLTDMRNGSGRKFRRSAHL